MPTTKAETIVPAPNLPILLDAVRNMIELSRGNVTIAINEAMVGFRLN